MTMHRTTALAFLVAFLALAGCDSPPAPRTVAGDPGAGRQVITSIGCGACHVIPGVPGARGTVGPTLAGFAERDYIGGVVPNRPALLVQWVRDAPSLAPDTAMPDLPLTQPQARDVAAYLYTLQ